jgi:hypothetical protein
MINISGGAIEAPLLSFALQNALQTGRVNVSK